MKYLKTAAAWFAVSFVAILVAQFAQIQDAVSAGDWNAAKKAGVAALASAFVAGLGTVLSHLTSIVGDPAANREVK